MKRIIAAVLITMCVAMTAHAKPPERAEFSFSFSWPIACDGYTLSVAQSNDLKQTTFFDSDGAVESIQWQIEGDVKIFRDGYPDNALYGMRRDMQKYDPSTGIGQVNGGVVRVVLPGYGPIYFEAGRLVLDAEYNFLATSGIHHDALLETDAICEYFR